MIAQEAAKRVELSERRALLADRVRNAYDTDRTSPLETFLSGGTFTDLLAEMSYYIDVGEQDQALADQITRDKETLAAIHQTVADTRVQDEPAAPGDRRPEARARQEPARPQGDQGGARQAPEAVAKTLAAQKARYAAVKRSKANAAAIIRQAAADQRRLAKEINSLIARQVSRGNIPSKFNGTMRWPMDDFNISGNYGCSSFAYYAPGNGCAHYPQRHRPRGARTAPRSRPPPPGPSSTSAGTGRTAPTPPGSSSIAHSGSLKTWYAHMQPKRPVSVGQSVKKGQVIGYEGSTGNSTGAHLHWMVEFNGTS